MEARHAGQAARVLVDCGFTLRELVGRLAAVELTPGDLDAVFVTHEHGDHVGCALPLSRRHGVPLWTSRGTWRAIGDAAAAGPSVRLVRDGETLNLGPLRLRPFTVPHDAAEPLQLRFECAHLSLGLLTDAGSVTEHMLAHLRLCDALLIEFNHDAGLLASSRYPPSLKARITGPRGHLCNQTAASILATCLHPGLRHVVAAHLSEQNNAPALVLEALTQSCGDHLPELHIASQDRGFDWIELH